MRQLLITMLLTLTTLAATAQDNAWEQTTTTTEKTNPDQKYLAGAVPVVDDHVLFEITIQAPGKTKAQVYDIMHRQLAELSKDASQTEQSRLVIEDADKGQVVGSYREQLIFKNKPLNLDYTIFNYHVIADCRDGEATVRLTRIIYITDPERDAVAMKAEDWITDRYGLNKSGTKLARVSGKFRRKTIDRKDYLFNKFTKALAQ